MDCMIDTANGTASRKGPARRNSQMIRGYLASVDYRTPTSTPSLRPSMAFAGAMAAAVAVTVWIGAAAPGLAAIGG